MHHLKLCLWDAYTYVCHNKVSLMRMIRIIRMIRMKIKSLFLLTIKQIHILQFQVTRLFVHEVVHLSVPIQRYRWENKRDNNPIFYQSETSIASWKRVYPCILYQSLSSIINHQSSSIFITIFILFQSSISVSLHILQTSKISQLMIFWGKFPIFFPWNPGRFPNELAASETKNSRTLERSTARPSALRPWWWPNGRGQNPIEQMGKIWENMGKMVPKCFEILFFLKYWMI